MISSTDVFNIKGKASNLSEWINSKELARSTDCVFYAI